MTPPGSFTIWAQNSDWHTNLFLKKKNKNSINLSILTLCSIFWLIITLFHNTQVHKLNIPAMALKIMLAWEKIVSLPLTYGVTAVNLGFCQGEWPVAACNSISNFLLLRKVCSPHRLRERWCPYLFRLLESCFKFYYGCVGGECVCVVWWGTPHHSSNAEVRPVLSFHLCVGSENWTWVVGLPIWHQELLLPA